jgi:ATP-binding protein involved in chromosome partitioning
MSTEQEIRETLQNIYDPELKRNIVELQMVRDIAVTDGNVNLTLALTTLRCPMKEKFVADIRDALLRIPGISTVQVKLTEMGKEELERLFPKHPLVGINKVKHFIAVGSGKGGVGKTTIAINLALALSREGFKVGLLDADVYGPSIPVMLGLSQRPEGKEGMILPLEKFNLIIMSIGFFINESQPVIWRGPLVSNAIKEFLDKVMWGDLDYLVIDLPPGTGDPSITIAKSIPDALLVVVTTPQEVSLADVRKAINMFKKMNTRILGIVENMSYFQCGHSEERIEIFGKGGGERLSKEIGIPLLGSIPIDMEIRKGGDDGVPFMVSSSDSETGRVFHEIAKMVALSINRK